MAQARATRRPAAPARPWWAIPSAILAVFFLVLFVGAMMNRPQFEVKQQPTPRVQAPAERDPTPPAANPCKTGYQHYPDKNECIKIRANPDFAGKAKCTPGEVRRVPNPNKPGHLIEQTCGTT